jgi:myo-inositol-1(or 4)-monophosphatase
MSDLSRYLEFAKELAQEAGEIMYTNFLAGSKREWKEDRTPLTATDTQINKLVIERISKEFSAHSILGEEESHNLGNSMTWVCDPVDGTMPFSHGLPISTFSLALTEEGKPIVGVVYEPYTKRMFWATKNDGTFLNGNRIHVSDNSSLDNTLIDVAGIPVSSSAVVNFKDEFLRVLNQNGAHTTHLWSIILPSALIAAGYYTATIFNVTKPEDGAAIKIIVEEAGGKLTDLFGNEQRWDQPVKGFVASNGRVHQQIIDLIAAHTEE